MIEDPLHFPKDIPVYMMIDMGALDQMTTAIPVVNSWERFGYTVKKIQHLKSYEVDFQLGFEGDMITASRGLRQQWYNHYRMWKKIRARGEKSIVIGHRNYLQTDIPRIIYDRLPFFPFQLQYNRIVKNRPIEHEQYSGGYFITPEWANDLINIYKHSNIKTELDKERSIWLPELENYPFEIYTLEYV